MTITPRPPISGRLVVDLSHWDSLVDHALVVAELRAVAPPGERPKVIFKVTDGQHFGDPLYAYNARRFKEEGCEVGTYHFVRVLTAPSVQLKVYKAALFGAHLEPPFDDGEVGLDIEASAGLPRAVTRKHILTCIRFVLSEFQIVPEVYTSMAKWAAMVGLVNWQGELGIEEPPLWAADFGWDRRGTGLAGPRWLRSWKKYRRWQYTDKGKVPGIEGEADLNIEPRP